MTLIAVKREVAALIKQVFRGANVNAGEYLWRRNWRQVTVPKSSAIRRNVAFSEAVYEEKWQVEDMTCHLAHDIKEAEQIMKAGNPALMIDPNGEMIKQLHPIAVVDAILAKKNLGTTRDMAPITIALGPEFTAGEDVDVVIETMRGHRLGRIIKEGSAIPNTGIPGAVSYTHLTLPTNSRV